MQVTPRSDVIEKMFKGKFSNLILAFLRLQGFTQTPRRRNRKPPTNSNTRTPKTTRGGQTRRRLRTKGQTSDSLEVSSGTKEVGGLNVSDWDDRNEQFMEPNWTSMSWKPATSFHSLSFCKKFSVIKRSKLGFAIPGPGEPADVWTVRTQNSSSDNFQSGNSGFPHPASKIRNTNGGIEVSDP